MFSLRIALACCALAGADFVAAAAEAAEQEDWSLSVCGTTDESEALVGSWSGIGESKEASVEDMTSTAPPGLTASGPCFAFDSLTEERARQGRDKVRGGLNAQPPAAVWTELTGKPAPAELRK